MPLPPTPETPVNHLKSIDDKLTGIQGTLDGIAGLVTAAYDEIDLSYTDGVLTGVVYKEGATTVVTLSLSYTNGLLSKVEVV